MDNRARLRLLSDTVSATLHRLQTPGSCPHFGSYVMVEQAQQGKFIIFEGPVGVGESTLSFEAMCIYWYWLI